MAPRERPTRRQQNAGNGKLPNLERMEQAAAFKACGYSWTDISRLLHISYSTLTKWPRDPHFQALLAEAQAQETNLQRLARMMTARQLEAGLRAKWTKEDAARAAERILAPAGNDGLETGPGFHVREYHVALPKMEHGLPSKPATEVLKAPARQGRAGKRRAAGPDE